MHIVRPATTQDLEGLYELAMKSSLGLTNLPRDREILSRMLTEEGLYIFCLERLADKKIFGTCMIRAKCPATVPLPYFVRYTEHNFDLLHPTFESEGTSELCGLFIDPEARKGGLGHLVSISRLLFIADHLHRFTPKLFAEIRGFLTGDGQCPFWDHVMRPFYHISFKEAVDLYIKDLASFNKQFPTFPIYYDLLPDEARKHIGVLHPKSVPAYNMLEKEGFQNTPLINPLDAGPRIEGYVGTLHGIQQSEILHVGAIRDFEGPYRLIATTGKAFCCTLAPLLIENGTAVITPETANVLQLGVHDLCRVR